MEDAANENQEEVDGNTNLTPHENEREFKGAFRSFVITEAAKTDIDSYFHQTNQHIKELIEKQLQEVESAKVIITLWVRLKNPVELLIRLGSEDAENAQGVGENTGDNYIRM